MVQRLVRQRDHNRAKLLAEKRQKARARKNRRQPRRGRPRCKWAAKRRLKKSAPVGGQIVPVEDSQAQPALVDAQIVPVKVEAPSGAAGVDAQLVPALQDAPIAPAAQPRQGHVKVHSTPTLLRSLCPPNSNVSIDVVACRWRGRYQDVAVPAVGFGPCCAHDRRSGLVAMLDFLWGMHGTARPAGTRVEDVDEHLWEGLLDSRIEQPRRYVRPRH